MSINPLSLTDFQNFFSGSKQNYGQHKYNFTDDDVKEKGTNKTVTNKLITRDQFRAHLDGKMGLGIIPVTEEGKCKFSVIDVDVYNKDLSMFLRAIDNYNFPIVPFKSKSGGLHLYIFFDNFVNAKDAIDITQKLVNILTLDLYVKKNENRIIEIFPKQYKVKEGSVGNWINLPYYNVKDTRQGALQNEKMLSLEEAIVLIKKRMKSISEIESFISELIFNDAPPCLQTLYILNPLGRHDGRNEYLFSFGAYLKKKDENFFEQRLFEVNQSMNYPLSKGELEKTIISSLRKKDYNYKCKQYPCAEYCNKVICKTREYGVGKQDGYFSNLEYGKMSQIRTEQPYYEWEIRVQGEEKWKKLRFKNEDEVIKQDVFLRLCFRELYMLPIKLKQSEWVKIVNQSLEEIVIVSVEEGDDSSPVTLFRALFLDFILSRARGDAKEQLFNKKVYFSKETNEYLFRVKDLSEFLFVIKNFRYIQPTEVHSNLRDLGCKSRKIRLATGKQVRVSAFPLENIKKYSVLLNDDEDEKFEPNFEDFDNEDVSHDLPLNTDFDDEVY